MGAATGFSDLPTGDPDHADVVAFLKSPDAYPRPPETVDVVETHAALIFLAGDEAYKIKKPVKLPYLDFSTLERRKAACETELAINRPHAPMIYLDLVPICRSGTGELALGGDGVPVEWAVHMRRFSNDALMSSQSAGALITPSLLDRLADRVLFYHSEAPQHVLGDGYQRILAIVEELCDAFDAAPPDCIDHDDAHRFARQARSLALSHRHRLDQRSRRGYVRRCHGDLHLNNLVIIDGEPVPFDAIEFDDEIATTDILYDLAFLIMDLDARGMPVAANRVLNRYIVTGDDPANISGLELMPLFLACRAAIRAMVDITRAYQVSSSAKANTIAGEASRYLTQALEYLQRPPVRLICIGGLSGTGKTTIARRLAPEIGGAPGALHLRSDVERKLLFKVAETERLDAAAYEPVFSQAVYLRLLRKARLALLAGYSVIIDAVFQDPGERAAAAEVAEKCGVEFAGIWLTANEETLLQRVAARTGDASDATVDVVKLQLSRRSRPSDWQAVDAGRVPEAVAADCLANI